MGKMVNVRLDDETEKYLEDLVSLLSLSESQLVRQAIKVLAVINAPPKQKRKMIKGIGKYASKISDLASNKAHLKGFGS